MASSLTMVQKLKHNVWSSVNNIRKIAMDPSDEGILTGKDTVWSSSHLLSSNQEINTYDWAFFSFSPAKSLWSILIIYSSVQKNEMIESLFHTVRLLFSPCRSIHGFTQWLAVTHLDYLAPYQASTFHMIYPSIHTIGQEWSIATTLQGFQKPRITSLSILPSRVAPKQQHVDVLVDKSTCS